MSRKEAKQEAEMRNSVTDLPSELATTQEEQEVRVDAAYLPAAFVRIIRLFPIITEAVP